MEPASFWTSGVHPLDFGIRIVGALLALWAMRYGLAIQRKTCLKWYLAGKVFILMGFVLQWAFAPDQLPKMDATSILLALGLWALWPCLLALCWLKAQKRTKIP